MRFRKAVSLVLAVAVATGISVMLASCGGGGSSSGGPTVDNSKASGTFSVVVVDASNGMQTDIGTADLDGQGHLVYTSLTSTLNNGSFNYTVTVPGNDITIDSTTKGTVSKDGNFFAAIDTSAGSLNMVYGVKLGTAVSEPTTSYIGGEFIYSGGSMVDPFMLETATPSSGYITHTDLVTDVTDSLDYAFAADGTFSVPASSPFVLGAISNDGNIMIYSNSPGGDPTAALALKVPGSGMTDASVSGTYIAYEFADGNVSGPAAFAASRIKLTLNGDGTGSYTILYSTDPGNTGGGDFTYAMQPDGTFMVDGYMTGIALQDGSMFGMSDVDPNDNGGDNMVSTLVAIKQ